MTEQLLARGWTVADTEKQVRKLLEFDIPDRWQAIFLPLSEVTAAFFKRKPHAGCVFGFALRLGEFDGEQVHSRHGLLHLGRCVVTKDVEFAARGELLGTRSKITS